MSNFLFSKTRQTQFNLLVTLFLVVSTGVACASPTENTAGRDAGSEGPAIRLEVIAEGLNEPLALLHAGDGSGRLFIVEQSGRVFILKEGTVQQSPFLDIQDRVKSGGEKGLLGLAFHPDFATNRRLFVNYTESKGGLKTVISEFIANEQLTSVDAASERRLLTIEQPFSNHNGGQLSFGPDGYLYIGTGDGGSGDDPEGNGQKLTTLLGKMLRIDIDNKADGLQYAIPQDNPFVAQNQIASEIWAYGFRNPWRFSFDAQTGRLYAGDVGQTAREEINLVQSGGNYGWRIMEGNVCTPGVNTSCDKSKFRAPIFDYPRSEGTVVIGGYVYRGTSIAELKAAYLYGDFGNGRIWMFRLEEGKAQDHRLLLESGRFISAFGEDENNELYVVDYRGKILKIVSEETKTSKVRP